MERLRPNIQRIYMDGVRQYDVRVFLSDWHNITAYITALEAERDRLAGVVDAVADQRVENCGDRDTPGACARCPVKVCAALAALGEGS